MLTFYLVALIISYQYVFSTDLSQQFPWSYNRNTNGGIQYLGLNSEETTCRSSWLGIILILIYVQFFSQLIYLFMYSCIICIFYRIMIAGVTYHFVSTVCVQFWIIPYTCKCAPLNSLGFPFLGVVFVSASDSLCK